MPNFDGKLHLVLGLPRQGKTSYALHLARKPFLFLCTGLSNQTVQQMDYVPDTREGLEFVQETPGTLVVWCKTGNRDIFEYLQTSERDIILDEIGNLLYCKQLQDSFVTWQREIGWKDGGQRVFATTHRPSADIPPVVYTNARQISWVGPWHNREKARDLYNNVEGFDIDFETFFTGLNGLESLDWRMTNLEKAVMKVKDL